MTYKKNRLLKNILLFVFSLGLLTSISSFFLNTEIAFAEEKKYTGLVQCDGVVINSGEIKCDFARLLFQANYLINWFVKIMFVFLTLMVAYAGYMYILGREDSIKKAKTIMKNVVYGVFFVLAAYSIVATITKLLGAEQYVTSLLGK